WLPRDAYLQERFCQPVAVRAGVTQLLRPGDLIFFGTARRCTHVGLHLGGGSYLHSSGREHGRNGIGIDDLNPRNPDPVARHYRRELRGAGRVTHSHDGSPLPG
ncbi:MAG: C40 family peptidase, partial [Synechococcaceae cyanobacterium]